MVRINPLAPENRCGVSQLWVRQTVWSPLSENLWKITRVQVLRKMCPLRALGSVVGRFKVSPVDVLDLLNILARSWDCGLPDSVSLVH